MEGKLIGIVFHYFDNVSVVAIELTDNVKLGDTLRFVGGEHDFTEVVSSMQIDGKNIEKAKKGEKVGLKICEKIGKGAKVYKVA
jgi:U32 family peptidase